MCYFFFAFHSLFCFPTVSRYERQGAHTLDDDLFGTVKPATLEQNRPAARIAVSSAPLPSAPNSTLRKPLISTRNDNDNYNDNYNDNNNNNNSDLHSSGNEIALQSAPPPTTATPVLWAVADYDDDDNEVNVRSSLLARRKRPATTTEFATRKLAKRTVVFRCIAI